LKTLIEQYDENRDGEIQAGEAASWLGRDSGVSARPFAVRSTRSYRPVPRATSQVWHLIDFDEDGQLTREEIAQASGRLLSLDADDDRILAPAEMASLREQLDAAGQRRMYGGGGSSHYAVIHLAPDVELDRLHYLLSDLYAPQQDLTEASFPELKSLFKKLDTSGDEWLSSDELAALRTVEPHLEMSVAFGEAGKEDSAKALLEAKSLTPEVELSMQPSGDRAIVSLGGTRLIVSAHNLVAKPEDDAAYQQGAPNQIRLMVHDQCDALFEELDANADGRLGEREIAFCSERLAKRDTDRDGQLAGDEFPYSMIVAFLLGERPAEKSFYIPPSSAVSRVSSDKPVPAWFSHADLNGDGDVSQREFLGAPAQFDRLDGDKDGYLSVTESTL
jgi:Ca2+-binding EF-hand superfamily protein